MESDFVTPTTAMRSLETRLHASPEFRDLRQRQYEAALELRKKIQECPEIEELKEGEKYIHRHETLQERFMQDRVQSLEFINIIRAENNLVEFLQCETSYSSGNNLIKVEKTPEEYDDNSRKWYNISSRIVLGALSITAICSMASILYPPLKDIGVLAFNVAVPTMICTQIKMGYNGFKESSLIKSIEKQSQEHYLNGEHTPAFVQKAIELGEPLDTIAAAMYKGNPNEYTQWLGETKALYEKIPR